MQVACDSSRALILAFNSLFATRVTRASKAASFVRAVAHALDVIQYPLHDTKVKYLWSLKATIGLCRKTNSEPILQYF